MLGIFFRHLEFTSIDTGVTENKHKQRYRNINEGQEIESDGVGIRVTERPGEAL